MPNTLPTSRPRLPEEPAPSMRELSMEQQLRWIERLFAKFLAMYGERFSRMWANADIAEVKTTWAEKLGGFSGESLAHALSACDERPYPPTLPEFIALCRDHAKRTPSHVLKRLSSVVLDGETIAKRKDDVRRYAEMLSAKWVRKNA